MEPIVEIKNVDKDYPLGKTVVRALRGINLTIEKGEFTVIAGPSGSGKTTLLNLIGCVDVPTNGEVYVGGFSTAQLDDRALTDLRLHRIGFIFQTFNLIGVLNLFQNVEFPLLLQGGLRKTEREQRVREYVTKVGLAAQINQRPNELSGGQRQRSAIARGLVTKPLVVLADEPTANLDSVTGNSIINLMKEINRTDETTFIFSTHDHKVMEQAGRIVEMVDGHIVNERRGGAEKS
jgi:putative ABC transport system ATP-binding protein